MDCDLYQSYLDKFEFVWPRLSIGGMICLDKYYSLKFLGDRLATDEFMSDKYSIPMMDPRESGDFQRWS
jgi:hypothetical protein